MNQEQMQVAPRGPVHPPFIDVGAGVGRLWTQTWTSIKRMNVNYFVGNKRVADAVILENPSDATG
jgi:hypothetical protein